MADAFVNDPSMTTQLAAGLVPMNGLDFALIQDHHVQCVRGGVKKRLDAVLDELFAASDSSALTDRVTAVEKKASDNATAITALQETAGNLQTAIDGKAAIKDDAASATTVYSSSKTEDLITTAKQEVKNELLDGVGAEMDTLKEVAAAIKNNKDALTALQTVAAGHIKYDSAQSLTDAQKKQARDNIDAVSSAQLATKLSGTVAKVGEVPKGGTDTAAVNLDTITDEGEFYVANAVSRPVGVTDAYQGLNVSVRKSGTVIEQEVRGAENGAARIFRRTATVGEENAITWGAWNEVGSKQDLSGYALKTELTPINELAQKGVDDAATAKTAADNAAKAAATAQNTADGAMTKATANETAIGALGALAHLNQVNAAQFASVIDLGVIA